MRIPSHFHSESSWCRGCTCIIAKQQTLRSHYILRKDSAPSIELQHSILKVYFHNDILYIHHSFSAPMRDSITVPGAVQQPYRCAVYGFFVDLVKSRVCRQIYKFLREIQRMGCCLHCIKWFPCFNVSSIWLEGWSLPYSFLAVLFFSITYIFILSFPQEEVMFLTKTMLVSIQ